MTELPWAAQTVLASSPLRNSHPRQLNHRRRQGLAPFGALLYCAYDRAEFDGLTAEWAGDRQLRIAALSDTGG